MKLRILVIHITSSVLCSTFLHILILLPCSGQNFMTGEQFFLSSGLSFFWSSDCSCCYLLDSLPAICPVHYQAL